MPNIGLPELIVIAMILILVFGASRLPQLGEGMGKAVRKIKRGFAQDERIEAKPVARSQEAAPPTASPTTSTSAPSAGAGEPTDAEIVNETKRSAKES